jgi:hypothetical protein
MYPRINFLKNRQNKATSSIGIGFGVIRLEKKLVQMKWLKRFEEINVSNDNNNFHIYKHYI